MSGEIRPRNTSRGMMRKCVCRRALAFLAITFAGFSTHIGSAQTPDLECAQLSNAPDDGSPLAVGLKVLASQKIDPSQAESACRSALRADPVNPTFMFLLGRALYLGSKRLEAIKYYLDAADRGHAGAMNDLAGMFEYGVGVPKNLATAHEWYEKAAEFGHAGAMTHMAQLVKMVSRSHRILRMRGIGMRRRRRLAMPPP